MQYEVYVGGVRAAQSRQILDAHGIRHVVNMQDVSTENFHERNPEFTYREDICLTPGGEEVRRGRLVGCLKPDLLCASRRKPPQAAPRLRSGSPPAAPARLAPGPPGARAGPG